MYVPYDRGDDPVQSLYRNVTSSDTPPAPPPPPPDTAKWEDEDEVSPDSYINPLINIHSFIHK